MNINEKVKNRSDPDFTYLVNNHDIIVLIDTWLSPNSNYNLDLNGHNAKHLYDNKSQNTRKGQYSGGISICYRITKYAL